MLKDSIVEKVTEEFYHSVLTSEKRQRRFKSSTFWNKFGFERRTKERVETVKNSLRKKSIILNEDFEFGAERKNDWIILTYVEADYLPIFNNIASESKTNEVITPENTWFNSMINHNFKSEREVECFFVIPLLEKLGYEKTDLAIGCSIRKSNGSRASNVEPDVVLYDGVNHTKDNCLLLVEAKKSGKNITEDDIGQAKDYTNILYPPYFILTNGCEILGYKCYANIQSNSQIIKFRRENLKEHWSELYSTFSKKEVIKQKNKLKELTQSLE